MKAWQLIASLVSAAEYTYISSDSHPIAPLEPTSPSTYALNANHTCNHALHASDLQNQKIIIERDIYIAEKFAVTKETNQAFVDDVVRILVPEKHF